MDEVLVSKPWIRKIIEMSAAPVFNRGVFASQAFWVLGVDEETFRELEQTRLKIIKVFPDPIVYYFGIGNIWRVGIDLIYPLLATDFAKLIATDLWPEDIDPKDPALFAKFIQSVTLNLVLVNEIDQEEIEFEMVNDRCFRARFIYQEKEREIIFYPKFDATRYLPREIEAGFDVLFTRHTGLVFFNMRNSVRRDILDFLSLGGFTIFQETVPDKNNLLEKIKQRKQVLGENFSGIIFELNSEEPFLADRLMCFIKK